MEKTALNTRNEAAILARALVDLRDRQIQKARIQFGNRLAAIENGMDESPYRHYIESWYKRFEEIEKDLDQSIADLAEDFPIVERMTRVKGVGKTLAMKVAVMIDIRKADTISALWRYAGYAVIDGQREKPTKGEKLHYNARLKTACYLVGSSFLKSNSPYRRIYDDAKEYYQANRPDWTKAHVHNAAMRKMIKIWLAHLWQVWREMEGLPVTQLWIADKSPHHRIMMPEEFGW
jgi:hypothetical protein